jgi:hypothetical protein
MAIRKPDIIESEIRLLDNSLFKAESLLLQFPEDNLLRLTIEQDKHRRVVLIDELKASIAENQQNSVYFFLDEDVSGIDLDLLLPNLSNFKNIIDKTSNYLNVSNRIPLKLKTTVAGSFGFLLTTPFEGKLFREYDNVIDYVFRTITVLEQTNESDIHDTLKDLFKNDKKVINKYSQFFNGLSKTKKDYRIEWTAISGNHNVISLPEKTTTHLYSLLSQQIKPEETTKQLYGIIKGVSLLKNKIDFATDIENPANNPIKASFSEDLADLVKEYLDTFSICDFKVITEYNEATEEETNKYELLNIIPAP